MLAALLSMQPQPDPPRMLTLEIPGAVEVAGLTMSTRTVATYLVDGGLERGVVTRCQVRLESPAVDGVARDTTAVPHALAHHRFTLDDDVALTVRVAGVPVHISTLVRGVVVLDKNGTARVDLTDERIVRSSIPMRLAPRDHVDARWSLAPAPARTCRDLVGDPP